MASKLEICNRALQKLGAKRITSLSDDTSTARACSALYEIVKRSELRAHTWCFATTREELAADTDEPAFGKSYSYTLPALSLRVLAPYPELNINDLDWEIEGKKIYTNDSAPLQVRYTYDVTDTTEFDACFVEALAAKLALEMCEEITQSNTKKESLRLDYKDAINIAKRTNAIERIASQPPDDSWVTVRS